MSTTLRVGAVENAGGAFSKAVVHAISACIPPAASTRSRSSPPRRRLNATRVFIEPPETNGSKMQVPFAIIDRFQSNRFANQHRTNGDSTRVPPHDSRRGDAANFIVAGIDE